MRITRCLFVVAVCVLAAAVPMLAGCQAKPEGGPQIGVPTPEDYERQLPPGALALRKITDPKEIPDFTEAADDRADLANLVAAVDNSLHYLAKPSSAAQFPYGEVTRDQAVASLVAFRELMTSGKSGSQINDEIRNRFDVYISVGCDYKGKVLFTGYYTPILEGSLTRTERFRFPLYKMPPGATKNEEGVIAGAPDRKTIESSNMYAGNELVWLSDPFEVFVAHVQGSAIIRLPDGKKMTVGYTANNGQEYVSVRAALVRDGKIGKREGLKAMIDYFKAHPADVSTYTWQDPRFIFFTTIDDGRPRGCLNEPVTQRRSIATDKHGGNIYPRACIAMVSAKMPAGEGLADYNAFALDQDTGGAIRAAGRCDIYLGIGDRAGQQAGRMMNEGKLYYIFLKQSAMPAPTLSPTTPPAKPKS